HDAKSFITPNKIHYPETWFHYIGGNVSHEGITADLEAIASAGISGVQLFHGQFGGKWPATTDDIQCLSENWDQAVKHTADECRRLGLRFSMQNCPGWAMSGGPWIKPENAMRTLVYSRTDVTGSNIETTLLQPQPSTEEWRNYRDITVLAFPTPEGDTGKPLDLKEVKGNGKYAWKDLMTGKKDRINFPKSSTEEPHWVEVKFTEPSTLRSIEIPSIQSLNHSMSFEPGIHFTAYALTADGGKHQIVNADFPQNSWQANHPITFACPEVKEAVGCRLEFR
ncbi:MAG: glycosyl hydrolase, partial [Parabacteroides sp.]|nr:glycosyl hydrolase [Parabacteroides sp.]